MLLEFSRCEDNTEVLLEALDPLIEKSTFSPDSYLKQPVGGKAASQLCTWVQGVHRLHAKLQATIRPLQSRVSSMKTSLTEYSDKLYHQENKVEHLCVGGRRKRERDRQTDRQTDRDRDRESCNLCTCICALL